MKIELVCPKCGGNEWEPPRLGREDFMCQFCGAIVPTEQMIGKVIDPFAEVRFVKEDVECCLEQCQIEPSDEEVEKWFGILSDDEVRDYIEQEMIHSGFEIAENVIRERSREWPVF